MGVGRAAPEIDMIEAQIVLSQGQGQVSQSAQFAPYDDYYQFNNASSNYVQYDKSITSFNTYLGGFYQQAASSLTMVSSDLYYDQVGTNKQFATFGFEYSADSNDRSNGYIEWVSQGVKSWKLNAAGVGPNPKTEVGQRLIAEEPMAMVSGSRISTEKIPHSDEDADIQLGNGKFRRAWN